MTDLATRYGAPSTGRRRLTVIAVVVLAVVSLAWVAWAALSHSDPEVTSEIVSWEIVDDHTATATFQVARSTSEVEASCLLRAQARDHTIVGELNVTVARLAEWRERALTAAASALKERERDQRDEDIARLKAKVGEITMDNELLRERIAALEGKRPLARRRSRP